MRLRTRNRHSVRSSRAVRHGSRRVPGGAIVAMSLVAGSLVGAATAAHAAEAVHMPDAALLACVNEHLDGGRAADQLVTTDEFSALTGTLSCPARGVSDLTGLEHATGIQDLRLSENQISELGPIRELTGLRQLYLDGNPLPDIEALEELTNLNTLYLNRTGIADLTPLHGLLLAGTYLGIQVDGNSIVDLSPLQGKALNSLSSFADQTAAFTATVGVPVPNPVIGIDGAAVPPENRDFYDAVTNSFLFTEAAAAHRETWSVDHGGFLSVPFTGTLAFEIVEPEPEYVTIPDDDLRECIAGQLGQAENASITEAQMESITELDCAYYDIADLTGIEHAVSLETLDLDWNDRIGLGEHGIEPLAGLTELRDLSLDLTNLSELSALAGLARLETLDIGTNLYDAAQLAHLAGLSALEVLVISDSIGVDDLTPIAGLTGLRELYAQFLPVTSAEPLAGMTDLEVLYLNYGTGISDLTPLSGLTSLAELGIDGQRVRLPKAVVGEAEANPVRTIDGSAVPSGSEFYDAGKNAFVFGQAGSSVQTEWSTLVTIGRATATFSGTLIRDVAAAPVYTPEAAVDPESLTESALAETGVAITGTGFPAATEVTLTVAGDEAGTTAADDDGEVAFVFTSRVLGAGVHAVELVAGDHSAGASFTVVADRDDERPAQDPNPGTMDEPQRDALTGTGMPGTGPVVAGGALLLLLGAALIGRRRFRR